MKFIARYTAQDRKQLRRLPSLVLLLVLGVFSLPWLMLFYGGLQARKQRSHMNAQAERFFAPLASYPKNNTAETFDRIAADIGFSPNAYTPTADGTPYPINKQAQQDYLDIKEPLTRYLQQQSAKVSGPLDVPPPELSAYLSKQAAPIAAVQTLLLTQSAPQWDMTLEAMFDPSYPFPGFVNVRNIHSLLLLLALDHHAKGEQIEMIAALESAWRLNQALRQRPDLVSQILVSVISEQQAGVMRHLDNMPDIWQKRLVLQSQQQSVLNGLQFDTWLQYKASQAILRSPSVGQTDPQLGSKLRATVYNWFSPAHLLQLSGLNYIQTVHRGLESLQKLEVCSTTQVAAEQYLQQEARISKHPNQTIATEVLARRWKMAGDRQLTLELTQHVLQAKQQQAQTSQQPAISTKIPSQACPEETWYYSYSEPQESDPQENESATLTLSLSTEPAPTIHPPHLTPGPAIPFSYQFSTRQ